VSLIQLRVSGHLVRSILRLPDDVTIEAAELDPHGPALLLTVSMPAAPPEAASVDLAYAVRHDLPDPIRLTGMRFAREDGTEITQHEGHP
jgi:hypothetical protein